MKKLLFLITAISITSTVFAGGNSGGGANQVEAQFELARNYLKVALNNYNQEVAAKLSEQSQKILTQNIGLLIADVSGVLIDFDHGTTTPFSNSNGSDSGIRTTIGVPMSPIEVRTKVLAPKNELPTNLVISYLGHELGHHLPPIQGVNEEQKAWIVASALTQLLYAQIIAPELIGVSGDYTAVGPNSCRDLIHVEADPFTGKLSIASSTRISWLCDKGFQNAYTVSFGKSGSFYFEKKENTYILKSHGSSETAAPFFVQDGIQIHYELSTPSSYDKNETLNMNFDLKYTRGYRPAN